MSELQKVRAELPFKPEARESHAAFEAFLCYFDIGKNRSCAEVARRMDMSASTVKRWSGKFKWKERTAAYHTELLRARVETEVAAKRDVAASQAEQAETWKEWERAAAGELLNRARKAIESFDARDPADISLSEIARALEVASKLGRLAAGLATDNTELSGKGGGPIHLEFEASLKRIYGTGSPLVITVDAEAVPQVVSGSEESSKTVAAPEDGHTPTPS